MEDAGEPQEVLDALEDAADQQTDCLVLPENWPAVLFFLAMETQWDRLQNGQLCGLNYSRIKAVRKGLPEVAKAMDYPALFSKLQILEAEVLRLLRENAQQ